MAGMEQSQGLHLQQTLSPQMQQSLQILQAPLLELRQVVAKELMENPTLEEERASGAAESLDQLREDEGSDFRDYSEPYYAQQNAANNEEAAARHQFLLDSLTRPPGLREAVERQVGFLGLSGSELPIAKSIAGNLNPNGYLGASLEEIAATVRTTPLKVEMVLEKVQNQLEPAGLAARDLKECLLLQLIRSGRGGTVDAAIVEKYLPALARRRMAEIAKGLGVGIELVESAASRIADLEPNPAREFDSEPLGIIVPEVFVEMDGDEFTVRLNENELPRLRISKDYKDMLGEGGEERREVRTYLREKMRDGRFFLRSIEQRNDTILAIAKEIVIRQTAFMERGPEALKPMTMSMVAETVGVHETTVSRAVSGKYMSTPHGIFEMKFFFTAGYTTDDGESVSNESVRRAISELIDGEDSRKPLSDARLAKYLSDKGLTVARRTIAKYRDQLGILPSHLRKR